MLMSIIKQIKSSYNANVVERRLFFQINEYCITIYDIDDALICSVSLPELSIKPQVLCDLTASISYECEYDAPYFNILFNLSDDLNFETIKKTLDSVITTLMENNIKPNACIRCLNETSDIYNVNGYNCYVDKNCANMYLEENNIAPKSKKNTKAMCLTVSIAFCLIGSLCYIPLGMLGIMPALAGIVMGLLASLGFKFFRVEVNKLDKIIIFASSLIFAAASNMATDFFYAVSQNINIDFFATYSDKLNMFNTVFDIIAGAIISISSMSILTDIDRSASSCTIKKILTKKTK